MYRTSYIVKSPLYTQRSTSFLLESIYMRGHYPLINTVYLSAVATLYLHHITPVPLSAYWAKDIHALFRMTISGIHSAVPQKEIGGWTHNHICTTYVAIRDKKINEASYSLEGWYFNMWNDGWRRVLQLMLDRKNWARVKFIESWHIGQPDRTSINWNIRCYYWLLRRYHTDVGKECLPSLTIFAF